MKTIIPLLAMMFMVGCGNNSTNQSGSANSSSSEPPASSSNTNSPSVEMTNAPAITNNTETNFPATTNQ
jgi:hypothetical protein